MSDEKTHEGACFCGAVRFRSAASPPAWAIAIASPAGAGPQAPSMRSRYGIPA